MKKLLFICILALAGCHCKEVTKYVTITTHNVTSDRNGYPTFITLVKCDDGSVEEEYGTNWYIIPIGNRCAITTTECN